MSLHLWRTTHIAYEIWASKRQRDKSTCKVGVYAYKIAHEWHGGGSHAGIFAWIDACKSAPSGVALLPASAASRRACLQQYIREAAASTCVVHVHG